MPADAENIRIIHERLLNEWGTIDKEGIVRWKFLDVNYRVRPTNEQILEALKSLP